MFASEIVRRIPGNFEAVRLHERSARTAQQCRQADARLFRPFVRVLPIECVQRRTKTTQNGVSGRP